MPSHASRRTHQSRPNPAPSTPPSLPLNVLLLGTYPSLFLSSIAPRPRVLSDRRPRRHRPLFRQPLPLNSPVALSIPAPHSIPRNRRPLPIPMPIPELVDVPHTPEPFVRGRPPVFAAPAALGMVDGTLDFLDVKRPVERRLMHLCAQCHSITCVGKAPSINNIYIS